MNSFAKSIERVFKSLLAVVLAVSLCPLMPIETAQAQEAESGDEPSCPSPLAVLGNDEDEPAQADDRNDGIALFASNQILPDGYWHTSGTCEWKITTDWLIIRPKNGLDSGEFNGYDWSSYSGSIQRVTVEKGVVARSLSFHDLSKVRSIDLAGLDTSKMTDMSSMFDGCSSLASLDLSNFDTSNVADMSSMFSYCSKLKTLDVSHFNTSNVTNMNRMFYDCQSVTSIDVSNFDVSRVTDMGWMFSSCDFLRSIDLSNFNAPCVTDVRHMFDFSRLLGFANLSGFSAPKVTSLFAMFSDCTGLSSVDLSGFNVPNVTSLTCMFQR